MRKALRTSALVLALGCPVLAGEIHNPPVVQPPPQLSTAAGEMHTPPTAFIDALLAMLSAALP
jgi:hypothetical protein